MHKLSSSAHLGGHVAVCAWKNALYHFQRILIECGSPMEIEHSQRLGLLFSKNVGCDRDVELWASLFDADDVPATSMMLKALVVHNKWQTALKVFQLGCDHPNRTELGEHLAQYLLKKQLPKEAYDVVELLSHTREEPPAAEADTESTQVSLSPARLTSSSALTLTESAMKDSVGLATDPAYVPQDEQCNNCGIVSAVQRKFPRNDQWCAALDVLSQVYGVARGPTKIKILECMVARCIYGGQDYHRASQLAAENPASIASAVVQRCLFHGALEARQMEDATTALERLCKIGADQIPRHNFTRFGALLLQDRTSRDRGANRRRATAIADHISLCLDKTMQNALRDFAMEFGESGRHDTHSRSITMVASDLPRLSISEMDKLASRLVQSGQWRDALAVSEQLSVTTPQNTEEQIVRNAVTSNLGDWQQALLFFS